MSAFSEDIAAQLQTRSQAEQIYDALKQALMTGDLKPGEALTVSEVAAHFSVSAMPVREALLKLAGEGLVANDRKKAVRVPQMSLRELREIGDTRCAVEGLAVRRAVDNIGPKDIKRIIAINDAVKKAAADADLREYLRTNFDFHFTIYQRCNMPVLLDIIQRLLALVGPTLRRLGVEGMFDTDENWHDRVIKALRDGDGEAAAAAICKDIESSVIYIESLETTPSNDRAPLFEAS